MAFQLGTDFPREGFVQAAIERHFSACTTFVAGTADFACVDESGKRWIIEAKGKTSAVGLDFRTGLGQLLQAMGEEEVQYGIAVPDTPQFAAQRDRVAPWVRRALGLHWLLVAEDGSVTVHPPPT